jgi:hypothetical protein
MHLEGEYIATRIETVFDINTLIIEEKIAEIEYIITKITDVQYLVKQINKFNGNIDYLLFFKNTNGFLSSSLGGIDNIYLNCNGELVHSWSIPANSKNKIINASATLKRILL